MNSEDTWTRSDYQISTDNSRLDLDVIHNFLADSYWAPGLPRDVLQRSIANSLSFGIYYQQTQVGFARVITDYATFAYLADVFVLEEHRDQGLASWLMEVVVSHPSLQGLRRWMLATRDAHGLYEKFGFALVGQPERWMERRDPDVYKRLKPETDNRDE